VHTGAQQRSLAAFLEHLLQAGANARQAPRGVIAMQGIQLLLGKIELRLGERAQLDQLRAQRVDGSGEVPAQRAQRAARRLAARGVDEVGHAFRLRQIEAAFEKGAARELAGLRQAGAGIDAGREQRLHDDRAAVTLQLEHFLAGVRMGRREIEGDAFVDQGTRLIPESSDGRVTSERHRSNDLLRHARHTWTGDAHDADATASGRCGDRGDRVP
jgi:hypothetical protein